MVAEWPTTVTNSRYPRALVRRTQKPFSGFWKVTRSTRPATASWVGDAATGFMRDVREARWNRGGVAGGGAGVAGRLHPAHRRGARCLPARPPTLANSSPQKPRSGARWLSSRASRRTDRCPTSAHRRHAAALHHLFYVISLAHQAIAATVLAQWHGASGVAARRAINTRRQLTLAFSPGNRLRFDPHCNGRSSASRTRWCVFLAGASLPAPAHRSRRHGRLGVRTDSRSLAV